MKYSHRRSRSTEGSKHSTKPQLAALAAMLLVLTACGGGGSSGSSTPSQPAPPLPTPTPTPTPVPVGFSLSGTITASSNMRIDSDSNNPNSPFFSNDSIQTAQIIPSPVTLGGYVNVPGAGEPGQTQVNGDLDDYFQVELLAGQTITLLVADFDTADADLYLFDMNGASLDFSIEEGEIETLTVAQDGTYIVNVFAFAGATNYILAIGSTPQGITAGPERADSDVILWQAVIQYRAGSPIASSSATLQEHGRRFGMTRRAGNRTRARLMALEGELTALTEPQQRHRLGTAWRKRANWQSPAKKALWETLMTIKSMREDPDVLYAAPNYRVHALATPNDAAYPTQWHYPLINLPAAWDMTTGSPEVIVAVVDTGILSGHPDMAGQLVAGYDFIRDASSAGDGNGIDPNPEDVGNGGAVGSNSFHGTHVSGTIAAASDNGIGVAGVAWNARIMPLRVLGIEGGTSYDVRQGVLYAAGLPNDSGTVPVQRADIINLSLGGGGFSTVEQALYDEVRSAGVIVVAAAGNEASNRPHYPSSYRGVISVSAVDIQQHRAPYSNFGSHIDIAAPGGNNGGDVNGDGYPDGVLSTGGGNTGFAYTFLSGTSMASPHVAGVLALMKSVNADLTPADISAMLENGDLADDLGVAGRDDQFGYGLVNAERAVSAALTASGKPPADNPRLGASTSQLNFSSAATILKLTLSNRGSGDLQLISISPSQSWLTAIATNTDTNGLGLYDIQVDRDGLALGIYSGEITFTSNINTLSVTVLMSVIDETAGGDVGQVYLLLVESGSEEAVAQLELGGQTGLYPFRFQNIAPGNYELHAGTDTDNDFFICDAGEGCGAYLTADQPIVIELEANIENIDFPIEYQISIPSVN